MPLTRKETEQREALESRAHYCLTMAANARAAAEATALYLTAEACRVKTEILRLEEAAAARDRALAVRREEAR